MPNEWDNDDIDDGNSYVWEYTPSHLNKALRGTFPQGASKAMTEGLPPINRFFKTDNALVLGCATDIENDSNKVPSIAEGLQHSDIKQELLTIKKATLDSSIAPTPSIIIPICQQQKMFFGLFKRKHWVTVHYNPLTNTASIIDPQSKLKSFFYPTAPMIAMLKEGLAPIMGPDLVQDMHVRTVPLGIQPDDYSCGPRARDIISRLSTGMTVDELCASEHPTTNEVVEECAKKGNLTIVKPEGILSRLKQIVSGLFFKSKKTHAIANESEPDIRSLNSTSIAESDDSSIHSLDSIGTAESLDEGINDTQVAHKQDVSYGKIRSYLTKQPNYGKAFALDDDSFDDDESFDGTNSLSDVQSREVDDESIDDTNSLSDAQSREVEEESYSDIMWVRYTR